MNEEEAKFQSYKMTLERIGEKEPRKFSSWDLENHFGIPKKYHERLINECKDKNGKLFLKEEEYQEEIPEEYKEILLEKDLFNKITEKEFDKKIVGEVESRKVIFLCANGRLVKNSQIASYNLLVNDSAGAGKDYVTSRVLAILPKEHYIKRTRISEKVFTYWHNSEFEPDWTWNGKTFYLEDISENVLNGEVFKVMCSSGSSTTVLIKQKPVDIEIKGKPVIITTTATSTPNPELTRRFVILNLDSSEEQTKKIMERHSYYAKIGLVPEYYFEYTNAMRYLRRVNVNIPYADLIDKHFPIKSITMRTHYSRFLDLIRASAAFHQYQRKKDNGYILATGQDYDIARECFLKLTSNKYMISLTKRQKEILSVFEENPTLKGHVRELNSNHIKGMAYNTLKENLDRLVKYGILQTFMETDSLNRNVTYYCLEGSYKPNEKISIPTYEELCRITETTKTSKITKITKITETTNKNEQNKGDVSDVSDVSDVFAFQKKCNYKDLTPKSEKVGGSNG